MKRFISGFVSFVIGLCMWTPFAFANDDNGRYTATDSGFVSSAQYATREEAIAHFIRAVGIERFKTSDKILDKFLDKSKVSYTYKDEVSAAVYSGLIDGYEDKTLRPQEPITRAEALVILNRALSRTELIDRYDITFSDTPTWAERQVNRLAAAGIVKGYGDGSLGAYDYLTPSQVEALCDRITRATGPMGDFYTYVNGAWLNSAGLGGGMNSISDLDRMSQTVNSRISEIIFSLYRKYYSGGEEFADGSNEKKIIDVYSAAANQGYRDKLGLSPIEKCLTDIDEAGNIKELVSVMAELEKLGFTTLLPIELDTNLYNSAEYIPAISGGYTGIDADIIKGADADKYLGIYKDYIKELFVISGVADNDATKLADDAVLICQSLAMSVRDIGREGKLSERIEICDKKRINEIFTNVDMGKYLSALGLGTETKLMIYNTEFATAVNELIKEENLSVIKAYLKASVLNASAVYLTSETFAAYERFENRIFGGTSNLIPSDYAVGIVQELLGWELGSIYIDMYFPENSKQMAEDIAGKIIAEYEELISSCTRMTPQTRERATKKLKAIEVNCAYPDNIEEYINSDFVVRPIADGGSLMEYKMEYNRIQSEHKAALIKDRKTAKRGGWKLYPQTTNAMYDPIANSINIPAGILQVPFFDASAELEENLGGIGTVIAHEVSHAFDSRGAQFDENGNLLNWWTDEDYNAFKTLCENIVLQYDGIGTEAGEIDGELTLDENLADLAGMSCILSLAGEDKANLGILFENYARIYRVKTDEAYAEYLLNTDEHSPAKTRVNRVLSNFEEFTDFYGVIDGDGMFIPEEERINVWR